MKDTNVPVEESEEVIKTYCNETGEDIEVKLKIENGKVVSAELYD